MTYKNSLDKSRKNNVLLVSLIVVNFLISTSGYCQTNKGQIRTVTGKKIQIKQLRTVIQHVMDSLKIAGLSIAIINNAEVAYHETFGVRNTGRVIYINSENARCKSEWEGKRF